jgi:dephospho-CoA kinase
MKRIGLTGSIGSGKSTVANLLRARGIAVLDADAVAREVSSRADVVGEVKAKFGAEYVADHGLNRAKLAELVFNNPEARGQLNAIVHPKVREEMAMRQTQLEQDGTSMVVQDIPLLFENGLEALFDAVILVDAPLELRVARVQARDLITREQILARDAAQMPALEKRQKTRFVLINDADEAHLERQLDQLLEVLTS